MDLIEAFKMTEWERYVPTNHNEQGSIIIVIIRFLKNPFATIIKLPRQKMLHKKLYGRKNLGNICGQPEAHDVCTKEVLSI